MGGGGALVEWFQRVSEKRRAEGAEQEKEGEGCRETQRAEVRAGRKGDGTWARVGGEGRAPGRRAAVAAVRAAAEGASSAGRAPICGLRGDPHPAGGLTPG